MLGLLGVLFILEERGLLAFACRMASCAAQLVNGGLRGLSACRSRQCQGRHICTIVACTAAVHLVTSDLSPVLGTHSESPNPVYVLISKGVTPANGWLLMQVWDTCWPPHCTQSNLSTHPLFQWPNFVASAGLRDALIASA